MSIEYLPNSELMFAVPSWSIVSSRTKTSTSSPAIQGWWTCVTRGAAAHPSRTSADSPKSSKVCACSVYPVPSVDWVAFVCCPLIIRQHHQISAAPGRIAAANVLRIRNYRKPWAQSSLRGRREADTEGSSIRRVVVSVAMNFDLYLLIWNRRKFSVSYCR